MKFILSLAFLAIVATFYLVTAEERLCFPDRCSNKPHIACGLKKPAAACQEYEQIEITPEIKTTILKLHNTVRNRIAGGDGQLKPAANMKTAKWNTDLATLAVYATQQCEMEHTCHNTPSYPIAGQNLAWMSYYKLDHTKLLSSAVEMWAKEQVNCTMDAIRSFPKGKNFGHFTALVNYINSEVGCGISTYSVTNKTYRAYLVACNYNRNNLIGSPIYLESEKPASKCPAGTNPEYPNLCA